MISNHSNKISESDRKLINQEKVPIGRFTCLHQSRMKQATILLKALGLLFIAEFSAAQLTNPKGIVYEYLCTNIDNTTHSLIQFDEIFIFEFY